MSDKKELSKEDKESLERYNNYVAGMRWWVNISKEEETVEQWEINKKKELVKKTVIKAPENAKTEDKVALERYNKFVANQSLSKAKRKNKKENIFQKDISSVAWKIRLIFLILAISFFLRALRGQLFSAI